MIREAFEELGYDARPGRVAPWIKEKFGKQVKAQTISVEKTWMKRLHDWVVEALQVLGADADPAQVKRWLDTEKEEGWSEESVMRSISGIKRREAMSAAAAEADPKRKLEGQATKTKATVDDALEPAKSSQVAFDALALLKKVKAFAEEVGGVERLREILDMLR
jgi:hypothetical protein